MLTAFVAQAILAETSLSFLGLGVQEPTAALGPDAVGQCR
jgi:peptide/nickel transport system permease protein